MPTSRTITSDRLPLFHVGDQVSFQFGARRVVGEVVEDRGKIGVGGRRLLRVNAPMDSEPLIIELPEEDLQFAWQDFR